jgi:UDP-N-acetyl-D-mannosaminuronic acid transferase (WecB/TagA/CpsF family)
MAVQYIGDYGPDGTCLGRAAADKIGFYGTTPAVQASAITTVTTTAATSTTLAYGFTTSTQADGLVTAVNAIIAALAGIGVTAAA